MPTDKALAPVWQEIEEVTGKLISNPESPAFLAAVLSRQRRPRCVFPRTELTRLRVIFGTHGKRIERELSKELRVVAWEELLDPACSDTRITKSRPGHISDLHDFAACQVRQHRPARLTYAGFDAAQGGERPSIHVENLVMGDQNTLRDSTAVIRSTVKDSAKIVRDDESTSGGEKKAGLLARLHEHYVAPLIVLVFGLVIVGVAIWQWPWIKEFLG